MDDREKQVLTKVLDEMKGAYYLIKFWMKGSPVEVTLADWIKSIEGLLK